MITAPEILDRAKTLLVESGWTQGEYQNGNRRCIVGALRVSVFGSPFILSKDYDQYKEYIKAVNCVGNEAMSRGYSSPEDFNDAEETTLQDVLMVIDTAKACTHA